MVTSLILTPPNQQFVESEARRNDLTKTKVINEALELYRKYKLKKELVEGFSNQTDEDVAEAMENFDDYLAIVDGE